MLRGREVLLSKGPGGNSYLSAEQERELDDLLRAAAVSAGWTDADTLVADVSFLETPHQPAVTCSLAAGTFTARWRTAPLGPWPLRELRAPRG